MEVRHGIVSDVRIEGTYSHFPWCLLWIRNLLLLDCWLD